MINFKRNDKLIVLIATGVYIGYCPLISGTLGSILGLGLAFLLGNMGWLLLSIFSFVFFLLGVVTASRIGTITGKSDNPIIVIDEVVGMMVAMINIPLNTYWLIAGFVIFRFFDIVKLPPANIVHERFKTGLGVMFDDIVAAVYTNIILHLIMRAYY